MPAILNHTSFTVDYFGLLDKHARQFILIIVKASFEVLPTGQMRVAQQLPVLSTDVYYGNPLASSIRFEADIALEKPAIDILLNGNAYAPSGRPVESVKVGLQVGAWRKELLVSGDRFWYRGITGLTPSSPKPFVSLPIIYERAFGGTCQTNGIDIDLRNPVGIGFHGARPQTPEIGSELPNVEYPSMTISSPKDEPEPAGFGAIARNWLPRIRFAGTYDEVWKREQCPLLPLDFDDHYYQVAPLDQQTNSLQGGEAVVVSNMTIEGIWHFFLPTLIIPLRLRYADRGRVATFRLDTLLLEPDDYRLTLIARAKVPFKFNKAPLEEVVVGHVKRGWWRAQIRKKRYIDHSLPKGTHSLSDREFKV